jgi:crossover junction endodeoxyribonuclease RuvC|tara:strand:- start:185 stop:628 length:444 start_codon:yes stop_codon:yes gene_type:complete
MVKVCGIDPGKSGGLAINDGESIRVFKFTDLTLPDIADLIRENVSSIDKVYLEKVGAMPKQGVSSTFKFGLGYGHLQGVLDALLIPYELVSPQIWQKSLNCLSGGDKNVTKAKAQRLFPMVDKITHAKADALLITEYGNRKENKEKS